MADTVEERIRKCDCLPVLPIAASQVLELAPNSAVGLDALAKVIADDPAINAGVLRSINSSFYGLANKVSNIHQAVALLGPQSVKALVLSHSLGGIVNAHRGNGFNHLTFWRRGMYCAAAARTLAARLLPEHVEDCFIAALLMDLGTLVLDQVLGEEYGKVYSRAPNHADLSALESHELGTTHARVGGILARHWKLPAVLEATVVAHHDPETVVEQVPRTMTQLVWLASGCADVFVGEHPAESIASIRGVLRDRHKIEAQEADKLLAEIGHRAVELAGLFNVSLDYIDYEAIVDKAARRLLELSLGSAVPRVENACNRRTTARMRRAGQITIIPCERGVLGTAMKVRLRDLSASGLGFNCPKPIVRESQFVVQVSQPGGLFKSLLYGVVRCRRSSGTYDIGAQLVTVLCPRKPEANLRPTAA